MAKFLDKTGLERMTERLDVKLLAKQDKLTGAPGQVVGFGEDGTPEAQAALTMDEVNAAIDGAVTGAMDEVNAAIDAAITGAIEEVY